MEEHLFKFHDLPIRTTVKETETWFVAKDVADILGYSDAFKMTQRLDDDEKDILQTADLAVSNGKLIIISESGLYSAIIGSQKPEAKEFRRWVTHEVLPAIRRQGYFATPKGVAALKVAQRETARLLSKQIHAVAQVDSIAANLQNIVANLEDYRKALSEELYKVVEQGGANNLVLTGEPYAPCIRIGEPDED